MEKTAEYFVPINEVAKRLDVPAHTLRYWEKQFASAIRPTTGAGGRSYYRPDVVEKIATLTSLLYDKGMTIAGVKKILHNGEFSVEKSHAKTETQTVAQNTNKQNFNDGEIDIAINLLKQAKMFLE